MVDILHMKIELGILHR